MLVEHYTIERGDVVDDDTTFSFLASYYNNDKKKIRKRTKTMATFFHFSFRLKLIVDACWNKKKKKEREKEIVNTKNKHSLLCYEPRRCRFACMFVNEQEPKEKTGFIPFFSSFHRQRLLVRKNESERKKNRE